MLRIADISSQRPGANAPKTEPHLRADRARRFGGRAALRIPGVPGGPAGLQPCLMNAARSASVVSRAHLRDAFQCADFLAACIRSARGAFAPSLAHRRLAPSESEGSRQVSAFRRPKAASPRWPKLPTCRRHHSVSARHILPIRATSNHRRISYFRFSNRQFSGRSLSAAESAHRADASHTIPSQIHFPKGSR